MQTIECAVGNGGTAKHLVISYWVTNTHAFLQGSPSSLENVEGKWLPETTHYCLKNPFQNVWTHLWPQRWLLHCWANRSLSHQNPLKSWPRTKAVKCAECSAPTQNSLKNVCDEAILAAGSLQHRRTTAQLLGSLSRAHSAQLMPSSYWSNI